MRAVNLARRPFFNRRPIVRLSILMWIFAGVLVAVNLWMWGSYFRGSSVSSGRLEALERQVNQEEDLLEDYGQRLRGIALTSRNRKAAYLNQLIHQRTFPWSRLFEELEDVLPENVYLVNVRPEVQLADEKKARRSRSSSQALTPAEARARARARALGRSAEGEEDEEAREEEQEEQRQTEARDRVTLGLKGYAKTEEALFEFVDRLYGHDSFLDPNLSRESRESSGDQVDFVLRLVYLTPLREVFPVYVDEVAAEGDTVAATGSRGDGGAPNAGAPNAGAATPETASPVEGAPVRPPDVTTPGATTRRVTTNSGAAVEPSTDEPERGSRGAVERTLRERRERAAQRARQADGAGSDDRGGTGGVATGTASPGRSRVSVAPRQDRVRSVPESNSEEETTRPTRTPRSRERLDRPAPVQPAASSSPRLQGLFDALPRFLRPEIDGTVYPGDREAT